MPKKYEIRGADDLQKIHADTKHGKTKKKVAKFMVDGLDDASNYDMLYKVAEQFTVKQVSVLNTFTQPRDFHKFLRALRSNKHAKALELDISGNAVNKECIEILQNMIEQNLISKLILPPLDTAHVKAILDSVSARKSDMKDLVIPNTTLSDECIDVLEMILAAHKMKHCLRLNGCRMPRGSNIALQRKRLIEADRRFLRRSVFEWEAGEPIKEEDEDEDEAEEAGQSLVSAISDESLDFKGRESGYSSSSSLKSGHLSDLPVQRLPRAASLSSLISKGSPVARRDKSGAVSKLPRKGLHGTSYYSPKTIRRSYGKSLGSIEDIAEFPSRRNSVDSPVSLSRPESGFVSVGSQGSLESSQLRQRSGINTSPHSSLLEDISLAPELEPATHAQHTAVLSSQSVNAGLQRGLDDPTLAHHSVEYAFSEPPLLEDISGTSSQPENITDILHKVFPAAETTEASAVSDRRQDDTLFIPPDILAPTPATVELAHIQLTEINNETVVIQRNEIVVTPSVAVQEMNLSTTEVALESAQEYNVDPNAVITGTEAERKSVSLSQRQNVSEDQQLPLLPLQNKEGDALLIPASRVQESQLSQSLESHVEEDDVEQAHRTEIEEVAAEPVSLKSLFKNFEKIVQDFVKMTPLTQDVSTETGSSSFDAETSKIFSRHQEDINKESNCKESSVDTELAKSNVPRVGMVAKRVRQYEVVKDYFKHFHVKRSRFRSSSVDPERNKDFIFNRGTRLCEEPDSGAGISKNIAKSQIRQLSPTLSSESLATTEDLEGEYNDINRSVKDLTDFHENQIERRIRELKAYGLPEQQLGGSLKNYSAGKAGTEIVKASTSETRQLSPISSSACLEIVEGKTSDSISDVSEVPEPSSKHLCPKSSSESLTPDEGAINKEGNSEGDLANFYPGEDVFVSGKVADSVSEKEDVLKSLPEHQIPKSSSDFLTSDEEESPPTTQEEEKEEPAGTDIPSSPEPPNLGVLSPPDHSLAQPDTTEPSSFLPEKSLPTQQEIYEETARTDIPSSSDAHSSTSSFSEQPKLDVSSPLDDPAPLPDATEPSSFLYEPDEGTSISKSFSFDIQPSGGGIEFFDCVIDVPNQCFKEVTKLKGKLEIDPNKCPRDYIPITPMLYLESSNPPQKAITVRMTSWCINDGSEAGKDVEVDVLHLPTGSDDWEVIATLPFRDETKFQFDTPNKFSPFLVAIREMFFGPQEFLIEGYLFSDRNDNFTFLFHLQHSLFEHVLGQRNYSNTNDEKLESFNTLCAKVNDIIKAEISSANLNFLNAGTSEFVVDENFTRKQKWWRYKTRILDDIPDEMLVLRCAAFHNASVQRCQCLYKARKGEFPPIICQFVAQGNAKVNVYDSTGHGNGEVLARNMIVLSVFIWVVGILIKIFFSY